MERQFLTAAKVLPSDAITELDYRKLFIDIPEVKNAWLKKASVSFKVDCKDSVILRNNESTNPDHEIKPIHLNGLYDILLELDEGLSDSQRTSAINKVRSLYHQNRNLCEDVNKVSTVNRQAIMICTDLELKPEADIETVWAQILFDVEQYFNSQYQAVCRKRFISKRTSGRTNF